MENDKQLVAEDEMIELEIGDQDEQEQETESAEQDEQKPQARQGDPWKAMQKERAKRKEAEERAKIYESILKEHSMERAASERHSDPLDDLAEKYKDNEDMGPIVEALRLLNSKVSTPRDDILDIQAEKLAERYPGVAEHKADVISAARKYGIDVKKAYFMLYGEEAVSAPRDDILRQAELQAANRPSETAQVTTAGNAQPAPQKTKKTIQVSRSDLEAMKRYGISPAQYAQFQESYTNGISVDAMRRIYGGKSSAKKEKG